MGVFKTFSLILICSISSKLLQTDAKSLKNVHELLTEDEVEKVFGTSPGEVPEYDVTLPTRVNHQGHYLSHDVSHSNTDKMGRRNLFFRMSAFDSVFQLNVTLNTDQLFSSNFVVEIRHNGKSRYDTNISHCHYIGHVVSSEGLGEKVAISNCDGLTGMIFSKRGVLMISPLPERIQLNNKRAHVMYKRSHQHVEAMARQLGVNKRSDTWCGVHGNDQRSTKDENNLEEHDTESDGHYGNKQYTIESLVVADEAMYKFHGIDRLKVYIPTLINMVQSLMGDNSIGAKIKYVLNRLQIMETHEIGLTINSHATNTLESFCKWATKENRNNDKNPAHFDHAALISRRSFCAKGRSLPNCNSVLGLADLSGMCGPDTSCVLSGDSGLGTAFTIAHETGHNLGAEHDNEGNGCPNMVNIMSTKASGKKTAFEWSACSRKYITGFLSGGRSGCLVDSPGRSVSLPTALAGQVYSLDDQCRRMIKGSSGFCKNTDKPWETCTSLWCKKGSTCSTINEPAAEGSECGSRKWCRRGNCVPFGKEGPKAVDGGYSLWSRWGTCTHSCGEGVRSRSRQCNNPAPKNGGKLCQRKAKDFKYCVNKKCSSYVPDTRMTQCKSKHSMKFEGTKTYKWVYNPKSPVSKKNRCNLVCEAPIGQTIMTFDKFGPVTDGTKCAGDGPNGVCINRACKVVGCDNVIGSSAKLDRCDVCKGDGSTCSFKVIRKIFNQKPDYSGLDYQIIAKIPAGARNITIEETSPNTDNYLALETSDKKPIFNMNPQELRYSNKFSKVGTKIVYSDGEKNNMEQIEAKGPIDHAILLEYLVGNWDEKYKVSYQYTMMRTLSRDSVGYKWITKSQGCSVECGGGKQVLVAECVRENDDTPVSAELCKDEAPNAMTSSDCNTHLCPPRWDAHEWGDCTKPCNDGTPGQQTREVMCVIESNGEDELLGDSQCKGRKPAIVRTCGHNECPAEWFTISSGPCSVKCGKGVQNLTVICQKTDTKGKRYTALDQECPEDDKPPTTVTCIADKPCKA